MKTSALISADAAADIEAFIKASAGGTKRPTAQQVIEAAESAERRLNAAGVAKTHRTGCEYRFREPGPWAKAYRYSKAAVAFTLRRKKDGWVVIRAVSETVYPKTPEIDQLVLTPPARDAVVRDALAPFAMLPVKAKAAA